LLSYEIMEEYLETYAITPIILIEILYIGTITKNTSEYQTISI